MTGVVTAQGVPATRIGWLWSKILDALVGSGFAQGDILYRGASLWSRLAAGTAGYVLSTGGAGADPLWISTAAAAGGTYGVFCTADKTKTSDTDITADPDTALHLSLVANKKYRIKYDIWWDTQATPDVKWDIDFDGTCTSILIKARNGNVGTGSIPTGVATSSFVQWATNALNVVRTHSVSGTQTSMSQIIVTIEVGASGGTLKLRWAQATSSATSVTRRRDTTILVTEIS